MPFQLTKPYTRLWSLDAGVAMVITDLHGDWDTYARYRDRFINLHTAEQSDTCALRAAPTPVQPPQESIFCLIRRVP